jgi:hypothetical protein
MQGGQNWILPKEINAEVVQHEREISNAGWWKLDFTERDECKQVLLRLSLSLSVNMDEPLMSLYGTEWREHGNGLRPVLLRL